MESVRARMAEVIQEQPEDATYEEIMRELAFERMVERGLMDSRAGRLISNEDWRGGFRRGRNNVDKGGREMAEGHLRLHSPG